MKSLQDALLSILALPTPAALVSLQGALLASGRQGKALERALEVTGRFYAYLCELESKLSARDFSDLASRLDIGAVGVVALESVITGEKDKFWQRLLLGGVGESLMVVASRQYVKAWEIEAGLVHDCAAWYLTEALWRTSSEMQPELAPNQRWQAVQSLLAPVYDDSVPASAKAMLLGRVFQMLLLTYAAHLLPES